MPPRPASALEPLDLPAEGQSALLPGRGGRALLRRCHANHTILRIAESDAKSSGEDPLIVNYNSALKVVNLGDPESSLILRKPRSPQGQGGPDPASPTGLTHVGGPRWNNTDHPAYRAILDWVREASGSAAQAGDERLSADSFSPNYEPARAGDGDVNTIWHTEFVGGTPGYPHELVVDLGSARPIEGILYVPRQDSPNGRVRDFEVRVSQDGKTWGEPRRTRTLGERPDVQVRRPPHADRAVCPASWPLRGRRPARHERRRARRRIRSEPAQTHIITIERPHRKSREEPLC